jgi:hypothetical protein
MKPPLPPPLVIPPMRRTAPLLGPHTFSAIIGEDQLCRIGAVAVMWAKLENCLNDLIWTIQGKNLATGRMDTQDLQITPLLAILQKTIQSNLKEDRFSNERKSIDNIIKFVHSTKIERNNVIHGTWATLGDKPVIGLLKADTPTQDLVTFEHYPAERLDDIKNYAVSAVNSIMALIHRIEALRVISSPPPRPDQENPS